MSVDNSGRNNEASAFDYIWRALSWIGLFSGIFYISSVLYFYFSPNNDDIFFLDHEECTENIEELLTHENLKDKALLVFTFATLYPHEGVLEWHDVLRSLRQELPSDKFAVVYLDSPCKTSLGFLFDGLRVDRIANYKKFVIQHNLHGYHFTVALGAAGKYEREHGFNDARGRNALFWLIPPDRSKVYSDIPSPSISNHDELRLRILTILDQENVL